MNGFAQFADDIEFTTHPNVWGVSEYSAVIEAWDRGIQLIILGKKTPDEVAQEVQATKVREMNKNK